MNLKAQYPCPIGCTKSFTSEHGLKCHLGRIHKVRTAPPHGTAVRYGLWACRCRPCWEAFRQRDLRRRTVGTRRRGVMGVDCEICPICGDGPYVYAVGHIRQRHGFSAELVRQHWPHLSRRPGWITEPLEDQNRVKRDQGQDNRRHWARLVQQEAVLGLDDLYKRLAKHWGTSRATAQMRVWKLREVGLVNNSVFPGHSRRVCKRGLHVIEGGNAYHSSLGSQQCRACKNDADRRRRGRLRRA